MRLTNWSSQNRSRSTTPIAREMSRCYSCQTNSPLDKKAMLSWKEWAIALGEKAGSAARVHHYSWNFFSSSLMPLCCCYRAFSIRSGTARRQFSYPSLVCLVLSVPSWWWKAHGCRFQTIICTTKRILNHWLVRIASLIALLLESHRQLTSFYWWPVQL